MESETELIESVQNGNTENFAALVRAHQRKVFALCFSFLRSSEDAEDAAQEVFIKAYRNLAKFNAKSSFSTWLYRIAYNHCMDSIKGKARLRECAVDRDFAETNSGGADNEDRELIDKTFGCLPAEYRDLLILREGGGLSYDEIAAILGISSDAVDAKLRRARAMLSETARRFFELKPSNIQEPSQNPAFPAQPPDLACGEAD